MKKLIEQYDDALEKLELNGWDEEEDNNNPNPDKAKLLKIIRELEDKINKK